MNDNSTKAKFPIAAVFLIINLFFTCCLYLRTLVTYIKYSVPFATVGTAMLGWIITSIIMLALIIALILRCRNALLPIAAFLNLIVWIVRLFSHISRMFSYGGDIRYIVSNFYLMMMFVIYLFTVAVIFAICVYSVISVMTQKGKNNGFLKFVWFFPGLLYVIVFILQVVYAVRSSAGAAIILVILAELAFCIAIFTLGYWLAFPYKKVNAVNNTVQPVNNIAQPVNNIPQPVNNVAQPVNNIPQPVRAAQPVNNIPQPVNNIPQPVRAAQPVNTVPVEPVNVVPEAEPVVINAEPEIPNTEPEISNIEAQMFEPEIIENAVNESVAAIEPEVEEVVSEIAEAELVNEVPEITEEPINEEPEIAEEPIYEEPEMVEPVNAEPEQVVQEPVWKPVYCTACGKLAAPGSKFCSSCGNKLEI